MDNYNPSAKSPCFRPPVYEDTIKDKSPASPQYSPKSPEYSPRSPDHDETSHKCTDKCLPAPTSSPDSEYSTTSTYYLQSPDCSPQRRSPLLMEIPIIDLTEENTEIDIIQGRTEVKKIELIDLTLEENKIELIDLTEEKNEIEIIDLTE